MAQPPDSSLDVETPTARPDSDAWYREREDASTREVEVLDGRLRRLSTARLLAFVGTAAPLLALETSPRTLWPLLLVVAAAVGVLFILLIIRHRRGRVERTRAELRVALAREGLARLERRWDDLPRIPLGEAPTDHPWAADLDVLGHGSLEHLLGTPRTLPGREALRTALLNPPTGSDPDALRQRQERRDAVRILAREPELLMRVQEAARLDTRSGKAAALVAFQGWAEGDGWLDRRGRARMLIAARLLGIANITFFILWFTGWPPIWLAGAALSLILWARVREEAHRRFDAVEEAEASLGRWAGLLDVAAGLPAGAALLDRLREGASSPVEGARALRSLDRISDWAQLRRSSLAYFPVALLAAWDIHPLVPMEEWRERYGARVARWLEAVGELELLVAFALLSFDHPSWAMPEEEDEVATGGESSVAPSPSIRATDLRHPLLSPARAVGNDLALPEPGRLLLVTGSNMSGKSTLLRALGVNQILLLAGGPVAASSYRAPPIRPWSCMRVRDSLTEGVSLFMAELHRLRRVVDAAREGPVLALLDEILQGTNTAERRTAARIVLGHLLEAGAVGAVSTHDLTLADHPSLAPRLEQCHLRESVEEVDGRRVLSFDHRLRPGPATSRNALLLLELVGLGGEGADGANETD